MIYIGCSGYYYPSWRNKFYPKDLPASKWFSYYTKQFNTLELNNTFYKFPTLASLQKLYTASPANFVFSIKVPRLITHFKQLINCHDLLTDFYFSVHEGLKEKTGPILFQLPARYIYSIERLETIIALLNPVFSNVIEFRDQSWWKPNVIRQLTNNSIHFSGVSHPSLPDAVIGTKALTYYRFHGIPKLYLSAYENSYLQKMANQVNDCKSKQAFIYFNNTITTAGAENAITLRKMILNK